MLAHIADLRLCTLMSLHPLCVSPYVLSLYVGFCMLFTGLHDCISSILMMLGALCLEQFKMELKTLLD